MNSEAVVNIAAYKFARLDPLPDLQKDLRERTASLALRGTILLSAEGINLVVAGSHANIEALLAHLRLIPAIGELNPKRSYSREQPFHRMLVKIKREIIAFGVPSVDPIAYTSKRISAHELKAWLDEGRPVTLLDTRNEFEVDVGTFRNAVRIGVTDFRDFPNAVARLPSEMKEAPVVTFCTGGIRCEKAAPYLESVGFTEVFQLDGGILKYLEECGDAHYEGDCFVFDRRVALDASLREAAWRQCFDCRRILAKGESECGCKSAGMTV